MGRHRRTAPEPLPNAAAGRHRGVRPNRAPVRTGLLGASAAMAVGAVAMASGLLPGSGDEYTIGSGTDSGGRVRAGDLPTLGTQGAPSAVPTDRSSTPADRGGERADSPTALPSQSRSRGPSEPSATPSQRTSRSTDRADVPRPSGTTTSAPEKTAPGTKAPATEKAAEAEVLTLVNRERATAGCRPVTPDRELAGLAEDFSEDMAERGFFDHTAPDGTNPWDRAEKLGISGLGGENIARGQADAEAVMDAWMDSPGHRANILNCDYKTLGVGAHFADGGPWWTQDFGF
ncbi:CAP domain-containing protein [Streptomyces sp. NPDC004647]|uniref:CAP domain-containing protein n=1 Tax=Streptomyces sp. NPDC004647 TaxID=3154671 RepID=UPI0033BD0B94